MKFLTSSKSGLIVFYGLCLLVAGLFYVFQGDSGREAVNLLESQGGYLAALKFKGLFFIATAVLIELLILRAQNKNNSYDAADSGASLAIHFINIFTGPLTLLYLYSLLKFVEQFAVFEIGDGLIALFITVFLFEGAYYWYHRLSHEIPVLWSIHHTHHSAQTLNLSIAFRLHTLGRIVSPIVYIPMILMGFKPEYILLGLSLSLIYQFFIHTETIPHLGKFEMLGFNTPSKHRVHHGSNEYCIDKNYGGMLIVWDNLFGTYVDEGEKVEYGVSTGFYSYNPLKIMFKPQLDWLRGDFQREGDIQKSNVQH